MLKRKPHATSGVDLPSNLWYWLEQARVRSRQECRDGPRPCPCVSCEHHLLFQVDPGDPTRWNVQPLEIHEMEETCRLDILERTNSVPANVPLQSKAQPPQHTQCVVVNEALVPAVVGANAPSSSSQK